MKKLSVLALVLVLVFAFASCDMIELPANGDVKLAQAALDAAFAETEIEITEDLVLNKTITDAEGNEYAVAWAASANVTLEDGEGKVTVKVQQDLFNDLVFAVAGAITVGDETAKISLTYTVPALVEEGQKLADAALEAAFANKELEATENFTLPTELVDAQGNKYALTWTSSNEAALKVEGGNVTVTTNYFGDAVVTLTGTAVNGKVASTVVLTYTVAKTECEHDYEMFMHTDSTCTEFGNESYRCKNCGRTYMISLPLLEHPTEFVETVAPTCEEDGYDLYVCTACDKEIAENVVDALGHDWTLTETVEAEATAHGYNRYTCNNCQGTADETLHAFVYEYHYIEPTCSENGTYVMICYVCATQGNLVYDDNDPNAFIDVPATGAHEYDQFVETVPATETAHGYDVYTCKNCDYQGMKPDTITHHYSHYFASKDPTCQEGGSDLYYCSVCWNDDSIAAADKAKEYRPNDVPALDHDYTRFVETVAPTCQEGGYNLYMCRWCNAENKVPDGTEATGVHVDTDDCICDYEGCDAEVLPEGLVITIQQANYLAGKKAHNTYTTEKYQVTGTVKSIANTTYGNIYIEDENGNTLYLYGLYSVGGNVRYDALPVKPVVGDVITVTGPLGQYNSTKQMKSAWLVHECEREACTDACAKCGEMGSHVGGTATCQALAVCDVCSAEYGNLVACEYGDGDSCVVCGTAKPAEGTVVELATFTFGANGNNSEHVDGNEYSAGESWTENGYTLKLDTASKVYGTAYDVMHNSAIKLGTSKLNGSFTFTVAENVTEVIIYVAKYKANATTVTINGTNYTISTSSNDGEYTAITIDTTTTKTIEFATAGTTYRCMIDTIVFKGTL